MFPELISGNINVFAWPATSDSGHFVRATLGETAASNCISPSIGRSGYFFLAFNAALRILSTVSPEPEPCVE